MEELLGQLREPLPHLLYDFEIASMSTAFLTAPMKRSFDDRLKSRIASLKTSRLIKRKYQTLCCVMQIQRDTPIESGILAALCLLQVVNVDEQCFRTKILTVRHSIFRLGKRHRRA